VSPKSQVQPFMSRPFPFDASVNITVSGAQPLVDVAVKSAVGGWLTTRVAAFEVTDPQVPVTTTRY